MSDENFRAALAGNSKRLSGLAVDLEIALERNDAEMAVTVLHNLNVMARDAEWDALRWRETQRRNPR